MTLRSGNSTTSAHAASSGPLDGNDPADGQGQFQEANLAGEVMARAFMTANPDFESNFRSTLGQMVGTSFSPDEIETLKSRAIKAINPEDFPAFVDPKAKIFTGTPVYVTVPQKRAIDNIFDRMGPNDRLQQRAGDAYRRNLANGKIRIR